MQRRNNYSANDEVIELDRIEKGARNILNEMPEQLANEYMSAQRSKMYFTSQNNSQIQSKEFNFSTTQLPRPQIFQQKNIEPRNMQKKAASLNVSNRQRCQQSYITVDEDAIEKFERKQRQKPVRYKEHQIFRNEALAIQQIQEDVEYMDTRQEALKAENVKVMDMAFKPRQYYRDQVEETNMTIEEKVLVKLQSHKQRQLKIQAQKEVDICPEIKLTKKEAQKLVVTPYDADMTHTIKGRRFAIPETIHEEPEIPTARLLFSGKTVPQKQVFESEQPKIDMPCVERRFQLNQQKNQLDDLGYHMFSGVEVQKHPVRIQQFEQ